MSKKHRLCKVCRKNPATVPDRYECSKSAPALCGCCRAQRRRDDRRRIARTPPAGEGHGVMHVYFLPNWDGRDSALVAAVNQKAACEAMNATVRDFRRYGGTRVRFEHMGPSYEMALAEPGVVFLRPIGDTFGEWRRWR